MSASARASEPSMEDILASIRRIISDDVAGEIERAHAAPLAMPAQDEASEARGFVGSASDAFAGEGEAAPAADAAAFEDEAHRGGDALFGAEASFAEALMDLAATGRVDEAAGAPVEEPSNLPTPAEVEARSGVPQRPEVSAAIPFVAPGGAAGGRAAADVPVLRRPLSSILSAFADPAHPSQPDAPHKPEIPDMPHAKPDIVPQRLAGVQPVPDRRIAEVFRSDLAETTRSADGRTGFARSGEFDARGNRLVSPPTNEAVAASFGALSRAVAANARSMEDVVSEALRPMLKSWLDDNLPALVEKLVKAEIERLTRQTP